MFNKKNVAVNSGKVGLTLPAGTRILLVEDNPENMILIRADLDNLSLALDFASNGEEAVEKRRHSTCGLVMWTFSSALPSGADGVSAERVL